jgi:hypothetical protein
VRWPSLFVLAGGWSSNDGGVMAEEEEGWGSERSDGIDAERWLNPEKGSGSVVMKLREVADDELEKHLLGIVKCIVFNIEDKMHLPSVKLLFELANPRLSQEVYQSFAEQLRDSLAKQQLEQEQRAGTKE